MRLDPDNGYGYCPRCLLPGVKRECRPNGNDTCEYGHTYPSSTALVGTVALNRRLARFHESEAAVLAPAPSREVIEWQRYADSDTFCALGRDVERCADPPPPDREPAGPWEPYAHANGKSLWRRPLRAKA